MKHFIALSSALLLTTAAFAVAPSINAGKTTLTGAPVIDGLATDTAWAASPSSGVFNQCTFERAGCPDSDDDCSAEFKAAWDDTNLYFLVIVRDELVEDYSATTNWWLDQSIEFRIDRNNSDAGPGMDTDDDSRIAFQYGDHVSNGGDGAVEWKGAVESLGIALGDPEYPVWDCAQTATGWTCEAAIPWFLANGIFDTAPAVGQEIGLYFKVSDKDGEADDARKIQWADPDAVIDLDLTAPEGRPWETPSTWGSAFLTGDLDPSRVGEWSLY